MARQPFPGTITSVEAQAKARRHLGMRVNVFVNDKFSFALDTPLAEQRGLRPGVLFDAPGDLEKLAWLLTTLLKNKINASKSAQQQSSAWRRWWTKR